MFSRFTNFDCSVEDKSFRNRDQESFERIFFAFVKVVFEIKARVIFGLRERTPLVSLPFFTMNNIPRTG